MLNHLRNAISGLHLPRQLPFTLVVALCTLAVVAMIPPALILKARTDNKRLKPRVHLFQDMDNQAKVKAQATSELFADGRGNRRPVPGTVARGASLDDHFTLGFAVNDDLQPITTTTGEGDTATEANAWYDGLPAELTADEASVAELVARGQQVYRNVCFTCHGMTGEGDGPTHVRAARLQAGSARTTTTTWAQPANLLAADDAGVLTFGRAAYPDGQLFDVIGHGKGNMAGYATQLDATDRWAVVAYVRALQAAGTDDTAQADAAPTDAVTRR